LATDGIVRCEETIASVIAPIEGSEESIAGYEEANQLLSGIFAVWFLLNLPVVYDNEDCERPMLCFPK